MPNLLPTPVVNGTTLPIIGAHNCGNCNFGDMLKEDLTMVECHGAPPTPVILGMGPQGPAIGILWPRLPRSMRSCALWKMRGETPAS